MTRAIAVATCCAGALLAAHTAFASEPAPARAQPEIACPQGALLRAGDFTLINNRLTIDVQAVGPGQLLVLRGGAGRVQVQACADGALPAFSLTTGAQPRLHLAGGDALALSYVVVVPERAWVTLTLPDRLIPALIGNMAEPLTFQWEADPAGPWQEEWDEGPGAEDDPAAEDDPGAEGRP